MIVYGKLFLVKPIKWMLMTSLGLYPWASSGRILFIFDVRRALVKDRQAASGKRYTGNNIICTYIYTPT